jgi:hypothetical protein
VISNVPRGAVFLVLGIAFLVLGASGQRAFRVMGIAFLVIGIVGIVQSRRS